jgi:hypothetical protein
MCFSVKILIHYPARLKAFRFLIIKKACIQIRILIRIQHFKLDLRQDPYVMNLVSVLDPDTDPDPRH